VPVNFYDLFAATADAFPHHVAVEVQRGDRYQTLTYAQLRRLSEQAAAMLSAAGLKVGERCVLLAENSAHWCAAYLGILRLGAVAVPFDTAYSSTQIEILLRDCGAKLVCTTPAHLDRLVEAFAGRGRSYPVLLLQGTAPGLKSLEDSGCVPLTGLSPASPPDPAVILYTSGTTSDPKGVVLTHQNLLSEIAAARGVYPLNQTDAVLGVLPLFHALAQMANLLVPFAVGARVVFLESVNSSAMLRALQERGITVFCCVPQFFYLIHARVRETLASGGWLRRALFRLLQRTNGFLRRGAGINLGPYLFRRIHQRLGPQIRVLVTGGSRFDPVVGRDFYRMGFTLLEAYGLTESSGGATLTRPDEPWSASVGPPLPGVEIRILPPDSGEGAETRDGEIAIRGPIVMQGYFNRPQATAAVLHDGWLHTGDLGHVDADGRLHITGRKKDVIVLGSGKNIHPEEIEQHYDQSPYIKELCVLGLSRPGEPAADRLHAVVVPDFDFLQKQKIVNAREIIRFELETLSASLPSHKRILSFDIWQDELPRTTTRKLKRFEIEQRVGREGEESEEAARPALSLTPEEALWAAQPDTASLLAVIGEAAKAEEPVHPRANLELDLGLDSMERIELITHLEQRVGASIPEEVLARTYTVRDLVEALQGATGGAPRESPAGSAWDALLQQTPDGDLRLPTLLRPRPLFSRVMFLLMKCIYLSVRLLFRLRVSGREHLPERGPFLLCPNHQSYLDPFLLVSALPFRLFREIFFVGAGEYFATPLTRWLARSLRVVPIDPDLKLVKAMQAGAFGLRRGRILILFPEGERSIDGTPKAFKKGVAILSAHLQVPIVPVALDGLFEVWPRGRPIQGLNQVSLRFGPPLSPASSPPPTAGLAEREVCYAAGAARLRDCVVEMWKGLLGHDQARQPGVAE
jgi:long-chain acyl-CoA synthetase